MPYRDDQMPQDEPSALGGSQSSANLSVPAGATVYDMSGEKLGKVAGGIALWDYFRLEQGLLVHHEHYVPKSAIARIDPDGAHLNITKDGVKASGWDHPPRACRVAPPTARGMGPTSASGRSRPLLVDAAGPLATSLIAPIPHTCHSCASEGSSGDSDAVRTA
jgi:hypothetical protein